MYKNILVPVVLDHEGRAEQAIAVARHLLSPGGKVQLLNVTEPMPGYVMPHVPVQVLEKSRAETREELAALAASAGDAAESHVAVGLAGRTIVDYADDHGVDCIIIASHRPEFADYLLGSTAGRVVRHASCSVHVIR